MKTALQLYTVRDTYENAQEFKEMLKKVKDMGYEGVEFAGYAGIPASDMKNYLKQLGLTAVASHHGLSDLEENMVKIFQYAYELGCDNIVCAYAPTDSMEDLKHAVKVLNEAKSVAEQYNITLSYHNHSHEFLHLFEGSYAIDVIKKCCKLEVDTYWVFHAKINPVEFLLHNAADIRLVHIKDGDTKGNPCALGEGKNDIRGIVQAANEIGMDWIIVENDNPKPDGISDVKRSIEYLQRIN